MEHWVRVTLGKFSLRIELATSEVNGERSDHCATEAPVTLDALNGAKFFSTMDLKSEYWQVELDPANKEKTAFSFGQGLWQFTVMPFGLCNAPATVERLMEAVLRGLPWDICLVYLDDIIVHARSFDQHLAHLRCMCVGKVTGSKFETESKEVRLVSN